MKMYKRLFACLEKKIDDNSNYKVDDKRLYYINEIVFAMNQYYDIRMEHYSRIGNTSIDRLEYETSVKFELVYGEEKYFELYDIKCKEILEKIHAEIKYKLGGILRKKADDYELREDDIIFEEYDEEEQHYEIVYQGDLRII